MDQHSPMSRQSRAGLSAAFATLAFVIASPAVAATPGEGPEVALVAGANNDYERAGLSLRLGPLWSRDWGNWKASLRPELELSRFRYTGSAAGPDSLNQGGAIARLHLHYGEGRVRPYVEGGLGLSLFSRDRLGSKNFSTHFQFSEHVAFGAELTGRGFAGLQYSHYSNGDIETPNDGIDMYELVAGAQF